MPDLMQGPMSVLFIDDDTGFAALAARRLGRQEFEVVHAADGEAGLARLDERGFDVVALDHFMPGLSGEATLRAILARPEAPPVVYVTGSDEGRVAVAALKAGAADYVLKDATDSFFELLGQTLRQAVGVARARRERREAREAIARARDRAELLLRECYHRVANSLALVSSMAQMQAGALPPGEGRDALVGFQRRVSAIAQVHRRLYTSEDVSHVALDQYLAGLVDELRQSLGGEGCTVERIRLAAEPATVPTDHAVSIGVIVSELVTNACKYAYRDQPPGEVDVVLRMAGAGEAELSVADRGAGLDASPAQGTGLGARVVQSMARALGGRLEHPPVERGTRAVLTFPVVANPDAAPAGGAA